METGQAGQLPQACFSGLMPLRGLIQLHFICFEDPRFHLPWAPPVSMYLIETFMFDVLDLLKFSQYF